MEVTFSIEVISGNLKKVKRIADRLKRRSKSPTEATFDDFLLAKVVFGKGQGE